MHIPNIIATLMPVINAAPVAYKELPLSAQMRILNSRAFAANGQISFWTERLNDENASPELRKRAAAEINAYERSLNSMLPVIKAAAHYRDDGSTAEIKFDNIYVDEQGNSTGDINYETVAVAGHPHAWCMASLINRLGIDFDKVKPDMNHELILPDLEKVYAKAAATYIAQLILIESELFTPPSSERAQSYMSDTVLLAANSSTLKATGQFIGYAQEKAIVRMLKAFNTFKFRTVQFVDNTAVEAFYDHADFISLWKSLAELDEEQAAKDREHALDAEAKQHTRELVHSINAVARDAILKTTLVGAIGNATASLKKAGLSDEAIASITDRMFNVMAPPAPPAPPAAPPEAEPEQQAA